MSNIEMTAESAKGDCRYAAYRLATRLFARINDDTALEFIASELGCNPCELQEDIAALKRTVEAAL